MGSKNRGKAKRSNRLTTKQTTEMPTTSSAAMPSMFNNAQHFKITGGSFNIMNNVNTGSPLDVLRRRVAPNAILNAGGRAEEVRCHPGTRTEVIRRIEKWADAQDNLAAPIFWLTGPAGAGKSAIMQTIAERRNQRGAPQANFFFFRGDTTRSHASPLVATLLHQIIVLYPSLQSVMTTILYTDPLIFDSTLEDQLVKLIVTPLHAMRQSLSTAVRPLIIFIDGLDECDSESKSSQQRILRAFDRILAEHPFSFRLLIASRDESQIRAAFNGTSSQCLHLFLDDKYSPDRDIRVFVTDQFSQIRKTHPLAHTLDGTWPSAEDINYIVEKSSGQFIFAATVMRFILDSSASPLVSLGRVQGAAQFVTKSPFSHLDAIYTYILSQVDDQDLLNVIMAATLLSIELKRDKSHLLHRWRPNLKYMRSMSEISSIKAPNDKSGIHQPTANNKLDILSPSLIELLRPLKQRYTKATILSCLGDLTPLCKLDPDSGQLVFYHASFSDYLLDQSRSGIYFANTIAFRYTILPVIWKNIENGQRDKSWVDIGIYSIMRLQELPVGLMSVLIPMIIEVWPTIYGPKILILVEITNLCIHDDDILQFRRFMSWWITSDDVRNMSDFEINGTWFGCQALYSTYR